ncbi:MAG: cysteine desulfurase NifS [Chloroflexota bacterium]
MDSSNLAAETIYLDHAATTPMDRRAVEAMLPYLSDRFGNPSSIYGLGRASRRALDESREAVAGALNARPSEIIFTSGGTESDNAAIRGAVAARPGAPVHVVTSTIEHHAVLHTCEALERSGVEVTYLQVDDDGRVDPDAVGRALRPHTALVSIMVANNEIGTIEPVAEIARVCRAAGVLLHTDAVQAAGAVPLDVEALGVDLLSLSGHKFYGPKGVGVLYVRRGTTSSRWLPIQHGGSQERGRRAGTENVAGIVGLATALRLAIEEMAANNAAASAARDRLRAGILASVPDTRVNGHPTLRLPNNLNVSFSGVEGESILLNLDTHGIAASAGSACAAGSIDPSHVLKALNLPLSVAGGTVRFSTGRATTLAEVDRVLEVLPGIVQKLRSLTAVAPG